MSRLRPGAALPTVSARAAPPGPEIMLNPHWLTLFMRFNEAL